MIRSKILDMADLNRDDLAQVNSLFNAHFGPNWPEVPCRRWEYCCAILFSGVLSAKGSALDIGCGGSIFPVFLKEVAGCDVVAMDPQITNHDVTGIHYRNGSMIDLGNYKEQFDTIFAMSSIEHVNAGAYAIDGMEFDTGDTLAMLEMCNALKPGGALVITTDFADRYYQPPGLWPNGHHRIYDLKSLYERLIIPAINDCRISFFEDADLERQSWSDLREIEPIGYDYTEMILTLKKDSADKKE
jgi:SAM-dependent methyltransferase